jgi:acetylornithine deacetylase
VWDNVEANREELFADVSACVRIPSVVGDEGPAQAFMRTLFQRLDLDLDVFEADLDALEGQPGNLRTPWPTTGRPNVVGTLAGTDPTARSLVLNGHIDVVSPEPLESWTHDPWGGEIVGAKGARRLYGRGALDMKSGTVANMHALKAVLDAGLRPRGKVVLQSVIEEEADGGAGTLATLLRGHTADAMLNPEPFDELVIGQPGLMLFRITVHGKTAHAAYSQLGVSAIGKILPIYQAMVELDAERAARWNDPFFGGLVGRAVNLSIGVLHAGDWASTVAGRAEMEGRLAFIPPQTMSEVRQEVESRVAAVAARDPWLREHPPTVEWIRYQGEPWRQDAAHPFVATLGDVIAEVRDTRPACVATTGGVDARFTPYFGMAGACIGARGGGIHGTDEYVELESLVETTKIIAGTIVSWCGVS